MAIRHLYENKAHEIVQQLINADFIITIVETNAENGSYRTNNTITWNPYVGFIMENGTIISPTTVLNHEFDHALQANINKQQFKDDVKTRDFDYGNKEERRVIENSEQITAIKLNEIEKTEVTRKNHKILSTVVTQSPISNKLYGEE